MAKRASVEHVKATHGLIGGKLEDTLALFLDERQMKLYHYVCKEFPELAWNGVTLDTHDRIKIACLIAAPISQSSRVKRIFEVTREAAISSRLSLNRYTKEADSPEKRKQIMASALQLEMARLRRMGRKDIK